MPLITSLCVHFFNLPWYDVQIIAVVYCYSITSSSPLSYLHFLHPSHSLSVSQISMNTVSKIQSFFFIFREIYHIKEESEKIDIRTQSAKDRGKEFVHSMETIGLTQEQIKEKLWWLER